MSDALNCSRFLSKLASHLNMAVAFTVFTLIFITNTRCCCLQRFSASIENDQSGCCLQSYHSRYTYNGLDAWTAALISLIVVIILMCCMHHSPHSSTCSHVSAGWNWETEPIFHNPTQNISHHTNTLNVTHQTHKIHQLQSRYVH